MADAITSYANIMSAQIKRLDVVAQNAANINTPGYLSKASSIDGARFANLLAGASENGRPYDVSHSASQGSLDYTGRNLDLAIVGESWFVVAKDDNLAYTRNGRLHISEEGLLVTSGNLPVLGQSGETISADDSITVSLEGEVQVNGEFIDTLNIASFSAQPLFEQLDDGVYTTKQLAEAANDYKLVQGALNKSNVDMGSDMVKMMEITRSVESLQRAISVYDEMLKTGINDIGQ